MMVQPSSIARILPNLAARPPTPPRESDNAAESNANLFSRLFFKGSLGSQTPDTTPTSSTESPAQGEPFKKRVAWGDLNSTPAAQVSSSEQKPFKSILKPYHGNSIHINPGFNSKLSPPHTYANLAAMLQSVVEQLAGKDRTSKMDAYTTLSGVLKASENVPDIKALKDKMSLLLHFIRRDLSAKSSIGTLDFTLAVTALTLLSIFLHRPAIAESIPSDFSIYLVEHATKIFEEPTSKDVVKHLMLNLAEQNFSAKIMNAERVGKLISALHDIESHVKGKSIVAGRINVYRRLLRQSQSHMLANTAWIGDVFGDMFSSVKDTRASAITFGLEAGLILGTEKKGTRPFTDLFSSDFDFDVGVAMVKFGDYYAGRLKAMVESKQDVASVPQIWSVAVLFLRSQPKQFEQWAFMSTWLGVLQACFNCSDHQAKFEANLAWNRLVFAVQPSEKTSLRMSTLLLQPLRKQLSRKSKNRKAALGSLYNLLYYSLKPSSSHAQLDLYWDRYVYESVGNFLTPVDSLTLAPDSLKQDSRDASRILLALFDSTTPRPWKESRAVEPCSGKETSMEVSELPSLDSKWLRKNSHRIFKTLNPLLQRLYWDLGEECETITAVWKAYVISIASPAIMEVKVSNETMSCVASIFGLLFKIWQQGPKGLGVPAEDEVMSEDFLASFETIIGTTIKGLGLLPFTEKLLAIGSTAEFVVIATPSHQPKLTRGEPKCPLHHLLVLLTSLSPDLQYDRKFSHMVHRLLSPFFDARSSKRARLDLVHDLLKLLPTESNTPIRLVWAVLADFATFATDTRDEVTITSGLGSQPLGADYRATLKILEQGIELSLADQIPGWKSLFEALVTSATIDAGDGGRALAVIEPLGRYLHARVSKPELKLLGTFFFRALVSKATYPKDRQALDAARRRLWGSGVAKTTSFDPYNQLYDYIRESLHKAYNSFSNQLSLDYSDMITSTTTLLSSCPASLLTNLLAKVQYGIASWIKDESSYLAGGNPLSHSITSLWAKICQLIPIAVRTSNPSKLLAELEVLICSGLESKHHAILNSSIRMWNSTFGSCKEPLVYPEGAKTTFLFLRKSADLRLPFFPDSLESDGIDQRQLPAISYTEDTNNNFGSIGIDSIPNTQSTSRFGISPRSSSRLRNYTAQVVIGVADSAPVKRSREYTPDASDRNSKRRSVAKFRHDDSQIQFEAIVSSPIASVGFESQLLTDRQKEVKERQEADAAMFPDLRSSPRNRDEVQADPELPLHRSSSKSRATASPVVQREFTPAFAPQTDFDEFVNSSPTPTRALRDDANLLDVPSSPPEAAEESYTHFSEVAEIPSSPPDIDRGEDTTTSVGPSAQINPFAIEQLLTVSTIDSKIGQQNEASSFGHSYSPPVIYPEPEADEEETTEGLISSSEPKEVEKAANEPPDTPVRARESSPGNFRTPASEIFHDTQTSPASSERNTIDEDIFVDARSSPGLNTCHAKKRDSSSSPSYFDESSALRLMEGYDLGSGRPRRTVKFSSGKEQRSEPGSPSPAKERPTAGMEPLPAVEIVNVEESLSVDEGESSSIPSLIAETPAPKSLLHLRIVDGEEIDVNETIVVDPSAMEESVAPTSARRGRKRRSDSIAKRSAVKKSKHETIETQATDFDDHSQGTKPEVVSPKKQKTSPQMHKATPSTSKRSSLLLSLARSEPQRSPSQSGSFVDHDASFQDSEALETAAEDLACSTAIKEAVVVSTDELVEESGFQVAELGQDLPVAGNEEEVLIGNRVDNRKDSERERNSVDCQTTIEDHELDVVADTIIGDSGLLDKIKAARKPAEDDSFMGTSNMTTPSSEPAAQILPTQAEASVQTEVLVEAPSVQGVKDKLQNIISDLRSFALSRQEMNELEDLFVDAKEQLYGAGRRGRATS